MVDVATSLLNVKKEEIIDKIHELEKAKTDFFHVDVMDGEFVESNTTDIMREYCEYLNNICTTPIDVHLMVKDIKSYIDSYSIFNPYLLTFHYEACKDDKEVENIIKYIKSKDLKVGLAISPDTLLNKVLKFLPKINMLLIMTVEPGKGGQKIIGKTALKVKEASKYRDENNLNFMIEVDGGINEQNSGELVNNGAEIIVSGNAILKSTDYKKTIENIKKS